MKRPGECDICGRPAQPRGVAGILCDKHASVKFISGKMGRVVGKKGRDNLTSTGRRILPHSPFENGYNGEQE